MENSQIADKGGNASSQEDYEILSNEQISPRICEIIKETEEYCFIVTPYFKKWRHLENRLKTASEQRKKIIFFVRNEQEEKSKNEINELYKDYGFDIVFIKDLHAKIYVNEKEALISSMNLYEYSQKNNYEIGISIKNKEMIKKILNKNIIEDIYGTGRIKDSVLKGNYYDLLESGLFFEKEIRYCINCSKPIKKKDKIHFCDDCFNKAKTDKDFKGQYCHKCGRKGETSHEKPFCFKCWKEF